VVPSQALTTGAQPIAARRLTSGAFQKPRWTAIEMESRSYRGSHTGSHRGGTRGHSQTQGCHKMDWSEYK
jgi:hypothetical protein